MRLAVTRPASRKYTPVEANKAFSQPQTPSWLNATAYAVAEIANPTIISTVKAGSSLAHWFLASA